MNMTPQNIGNQNLKETVVFDGNHISDVRMKIEVDGFPLHEGDFDTLIQEGGGIVDWSKRFLLISIGGVVIYISKVIQFISDFRTTDNKNEVILKIEKFEWIAISISLGLCIILWVLGFCFKSRKQKLINKIKEFYKSKKNG